MTTGGCRLHTVWSKLGIMYTLAETSVTCTFAVSVKGKNMKENIKSITENCVPVLKFSQWGDWGLRILVFWLWCCSAEWVNPWSWRWNVLLNAGNHFSSDSITSQKTGIIENYIFANEIVVIVQNSSLVVVDKGYTVTVKSKCAMWNFFLWFYNIDSA